VAHFSPFACTDVLLYRILKMVMLKEIQNEGIRGLYHLDRVIIQLPELPDRDRGSATLVCWA
jgi:hypothetical protein